MDEADGREREDAVDDADVEESSTCKHYLGEKSAAYKYAVAVATAGLPHVLRGGKLGPVPQPAQKLHGPVMKVHPRAVYSRPSEQHFCPIVELGIVSWKQQYGARTRLSIYFLQFALSILFSPIRALEG